MANFRRIRHGRGFSLVELSVVLVIIGAVLGIVVSGLTSYAQNTAYASTRSKQNVIQDVLIAFLRTQRRLPCPDTGPAGVAPAVTNLRDGVENRMNDLPLDVTSNCRASAGTVPYMTLGLPREAALDHWGNFFTYVVSNNNAPYPTRDWMIAENFRTGAAGDIRVLDDAGAETRAVVLIVSHGTNAAGAITGQRGRLSGKRRAAPVLQA